MEIAVAFGLFSIFSISFWCSTFPKEFIHSLLFNGSNGIITSLILWILIAFILNLLYIIII